MFPVGLVNKSIKPFIRGQGLNQKFKEPMFGQEPDGGSLSVEDNMFIEDSDLMASGCV